MKIDCNVIMKTTGRGSPGMIGRFGNNSNFNKKSQMYIRNDIKIKNQLKR